jgi:hypothetical protein
MDLVNVSEIGNLEFPYLVLFAFIAICVVGGACTLIYLGVCAGIDAWMARRSRRVEREIWLAEQARIHRESK